MTFESVNNDSSEMELATEKRVGDRSKQSTELGYNSGSVLELRMLNRTG